MSDQHDVFRILLVEDRQEDINIVKSKLDDAIVNFELACADSMRGAIALLEKSEFDVVLLDLTLPDADGMQTVTHVYQSAPNTPIVVLTGLCDDIMAMRAIREGVQDYLVKDNINSEILSRTIRHSIERKRAEHELALEKERLAITLGSIGEAVIAVDEGARVVLINDIAEAMTGYTENTAIGQRAADVVQLRHIEGKPENFDPFAEVRHCNERITILDDVEIVSQDGSTTLVIGSCSPIYENDSLQGMVLVLNDVTAKRRMEHEMIKNQRLESVGVLAGGIAHDFNNLLTGIIGNVSMARIRLQHSDEKNEKVRDILARAELAAERAADITNQLLTFASGGLPVKETVALHSLMAEIVQFALHGSRTRHALTIPDDLYPIDIDRTQFGQVIQNLVINADQAMPDSGTISVAAENVTMGPENPAMLDVGDYVKISISDQGIGIPAGQIKKIFDPFFTTKAKGRGLGLATAHSIMSGHSGAIRVDSTDGSGTTFSIFFPRSEAAVDVSHGRADVLNPGLQNIRILLMDDDAIICDTAKEMLESIGYSVAIANEGSEAIDLVRIAVAAGQPFDIVLLDLTIPGGMGGQETIKIIRSITPAVKALVCSGYSHAPVLSNYEEFGFDGAIKKPFKFEVLHELLQRTVCQSGDQSS